METLACKSSRACPSCWHFTAGQCALAGLLREAFETPTPPMGVARLALA